MTNTTSPSRTALSLARRADCSQEQADAYRVLAAIVAADPRLASIVEFEQGRATDKAYEFDADAEDLRERALVAGFDPERDL